MKWSLVFTFFRSLELEHLERSLYSLSKQDAQPDEYIFFDNNNGKFSEAQLTAEINKHFDIAKWRLHFDKHDGNCRTLTWANNAAIRLASNNAFMLLRADIIYDFQFCRQMLLRYDNNPNRFCSSWLMFMGSPEVSVDYDSVAWRDNPNNLNQITKGCTLHSISDQDAGSFMTSMQAMDKAGWYDEFLVGWGLDQIDLQNFLRNGGVETVIAPWVMQWHQFHSLVDGDTRDLVKAMEVYKRSPRRIPEIEAAIKKQQRHDATDPAEKAALEKLVDG